jgi:chemotaxis protein MotB
MAKKKEDRPIIRMGAPDWVVTFGDMMTLLLCFFVLLFAMSEVDAVKMRIITSSIRDWLGQEPASRPTFTPKHVPGAALEKMRDSEQGEMREGGRADQITLKDVEERVQNLRIQPPVSITTGFKLRFGEDDLELTPESKKNLDRIVELLRGYPRQQVNIIGHAKKSLKPTVKYPDLYELSWLRARKIHALLIGNKHKMDPRQFKITAVGGYYPPVPSNWSKQDLSDNDRVEIIVTKVPLPSIPDQEQIYRYNIIGTKPE